jgi:DNA-binding response OmpR family regulator
MMRILYVEGHADSCELFVLWFGNLGYEVSAASTISDGLRLARRGTFAAYILSSKFPDGSGYQLCREIRSFDERTPIIFYSALTRDRDQEAAMDAGAQAYLIKPDDFEKIEPTIKRLIRHDS